MKNKAIEKNYEFRKFDPLSCTKDEWKQYHEFRRLKGKEVNPDLPSSNDETAEKAIIANLENSEVEIHLTNIVELNTNRIIGEIMRAVITENSPSFEGTKHLAQFDIYILNEYRRQGLGTKALKLVYDFAINKEKALLMTGSEEEAGRVFLEKFGAQIGLSGVENRLNLDEVDWEMVSTWEKGGQKKSPGTKLEAYNIIPEELIEKFCILLTEVINQQPLGTLNVGAIVITPEVFREQEKMFEKMGRKEIHMVTIEPNGDLSGLTQMRYNPDREIIISQLMTGVQEQHRGRGLGKWLKAAMLLKVKKELPKVKIVTTGNATTNAPMLSINDRLGFKKHKEVISAQITIDSLKEQFS